MSTTNTAPPFHSPEERLVNLLLAVAELTRPCRACGEMLYFVRHYKSEKLTPYTKVGINHFSNCPNPGLFRKPVESAAERARHELMRRIDRPGNSEFDT